MKVLVTTCDKSIWTIRPFAQLFNTYWSGQQIVTVLCENFPPWPVEHNFDFQQVLVDGSPGRWPVDRWSDGIISYLQSISEQQIVFMLDDYWLNRYVNLPAISSLAEFMQRDPNILKIDLTTDRLYARHDNGASIANPPGDHKDYAKWGHCDIFSSPKGVQYQMSLMPAIWNKERLLEIIQPGWTPWDFELIGTHVFNEHFSHLKVLGTRQYPVNITNALRNENPNVDTRGIEPQHIEMMQAKGWFMGRNNG